MGPVISRGARKLVGTTKKMGSGISRDARKLVWTP